MPVRLARPIHITLTVRLPVRRSSSSLSSSSLESLTGVGSWGPGRLIFRRKKVKLKKITENAKLPAATALATRCKALSHLVSSTLLCPCEDLTKWKMELAANLCDFRHWIVCLVKQKLLRRIFSMSRKSKSRSKRYADAGVPVRPLLLSLDRLGLKISRHSGGILDSSLPGHSRR